MAKGLIYVAGDPDGFPMEYYDPDSRDFQGVLPALLRRFAQEYDYEVAYYEPEESDRRLSLAEQQQVDLVSGRLEDAVPHTTGKPLLIFSAEVGGETVEYGLWVTDVAPAQLGTELGAFLNGISQADRDGLLLESVQEAQPHSQSVLTFAAGGVVLTAVLLMAVLILSVRRFRRRIKQYELEREVDPETRLGNLVWLRRRFSADISHRTRMLYSLYYIQVDVDHLSGRETTGDILSGIAEVLKDYAAGGDLLARVSEDGFVLLRSDQTGAVPEMWVPEALDRIRALPQAADEGLTVGAGVCPLREEDWDLGDLLFRARMCARASCAEQEDFRICLVEQEQQIQEERRFRLDARRGLERREFQLYLQSFVSAADGRIVGAEALTRWNHPERGFLMPDCFIPQMERDGLITSLDHDTLKRACDFLEDLWQAGVEDFFLSCNFSRSSFSAHDFVARCSAVLEGYHFSRELLIFEMTESILPHEEQQVMKNVSALKDLGVRLALDDFGTGFTSFYDLQEYPIDAIKLDKALVDHLGTPKGMTIAESMIRTGHALGLTVLAEGVENDEQARILRDMGCDVFQGFHFSYPVPAWDARAKILQNYQRAQAQGI